MEYEYDEAKSRKNYEERGIDFEFASRILMATILNNKIGGMSTERGDLSQSVGSAARFLLSYTRVARGEGASSPPVAQTGENGMPTVKQSRRGRVDWRRVDATTDEDIARQITEDPDNAPESTEEDLDEAWIVHPDGTRERYRDRVPRRDGSTRGSEED
jgi:hypothetical protein